MATNIQPFCYRPTPAGYECGVCHQEGVKLWRVGASSHIQLFCARCGCAQAKLDITLDADGKHKTEYSYTDQIYNKEAGDNLVPAVPDEDGKSWWGYSSVPEDGVRWWRSLPTYPAPAQSN